MSRPAFSLPLAAGHYPGSALLGSAPIAHPTKKERPDRQIQISRLITLQICAAGYTGEYFHPHLDSQNFHGSRLLGSRVATIPFPINRNVHFLFFFFFPQATFLESNFIETIFNSLSLSKGREKNISKSRYLFSNSERSITQDLFGLGSR